MNKERPKLHFDTENTYTFHMVLALLPLIIYGFYKNGILPFLNQDIGFLSMLKPLLLPLFGLSSGALSDYLVWWGSDETTIWTRSPLYGLLLGMMLPINANPIVVVILLTITFYLFRRLKIKKISPLFSINMLLIILLIIIAQVKYQNMSEMNHPIIYSLLDVIFGRNVGGVCTTSILWSLISFIYLWFDPYYKKDIPLYLLGSYFITALLCEMIVPSGDYFQTILNSSVFFGSIFIASEIKYSPYMEKAKSIYGILIGILCFFFTRFLWKEVGIYISIFIVSIFVPILNQMAIKIEEKKTSFVEWQNTKKKIRE